MSRGAKGTLLEQIDSQTYDLVIIDAAGGLGHDANGNRLSQTGANPATFTYDYLNRLTTVASGSANVQYAHDGLGNRLVRSYNGFHRRYVIDPNGRLPNVTAETDSTGKAQAYYIYGLGLAYKVLSPTISTAGAVLLHRCLEYHLLQGTQRKPEFNRDLSDNAFLRVLCVSAVKDRRARHDG